MATPQPPTPPPAQGQQTDLRVSAQQLAAMTRLVRAALPVGLAAAVIEDPQWPDVAAHLHRIDHQHSDPAITAGTGGTTQQRLSCIAVQLQGLPRPALALVRLLHAATSPSPGVRLAALTRPTTPVRRPDAGTAPGPGAG
jgi:hypothetical protein